MMRTILILLLSFSIFSIAFSKAIYISPNGSDQNKGLTKENPLQTITYALSTANPGDEIRLLHGTYYGKTIIHDINGSPDKPITITSDDLNPEKYAIIDGKAQPATGIKKNAFSIDSTSWLTIKNLKIQNCWTDVIVLKNSCYISFIGCSFQGGRRVIHPMGKACHNFLIEKCTWDQGEDVWTTNDWSEMHHGNISYYNGALFHPSNTSGGFVMRWNTITNVFNAFRSKPKSINRDCNGEIYGNIIQNVADNDFEPEIWAWNIHYYHNQIHNIHKTYSIDDVKGGPIYIYGNVITQSKDSISLKKVSGIFKFRHGPLTQPCYAFNNSYYTEAKVLKAKEGNNQLLKHFNNAYSFFPRTGERFYIGIWHESFEFDYDCINQSWPKNIINNNQEQHGIENHQGKIFSDPDNGNFKLASTSSCIDAGKVMSFPEFNWTQSYQGNAPDIGAYEGDDLVEGPPFQFRQPEGGCTYNEKPRIVRHRINDSLLIIYFSAELDPKTVFKDSIQILMGENNVSAINVSFPNSKHEMYIHTNQKLLDNKDLSVYFIGRPIGVNGEQMVHWASTINYSKFVIPTK